MCFTFKKWFIKKVKLNSLFYNLSLLNTTHNNQSCLTKMSEWTCRNMLPPTGQLEVAALLSLKFMCCNSKSMYEHIVREIFCEQR